MTLPVVPPDEQDAVEKLTARVAGMEDSTQVEGGAAPSLSGSVKLSAPNFLSKAARRDLYKAMGGAGFVTVVLAAAVILSARSDSSDHWVGPTMMLLFVGLAAWAIAYFTVAGFAKVDVSIGQPAGTEPEPEAEAELVLKPEKDEKDVALNTSVTATFADAVNPDTVTKDSFTLTADGETTPVPATVTYDLEHQIATLKPDADLTAGTVYTAALTDAIKDTDGESVAPVSWKFTTKST